MIGYVEERGIEIEVGKRECKEVGFENGEKGYLGMGLGNMGRGYEVGNR